MVSYLAARNTLVNSPPASATNEVDVTPGSGGYVGGAACPQRLETFCAGPLEWILFDEDDARAAGVVRAELKAVGKPIGAYDVVLAGQARRRGVTLVTSDTEFARVPGLKWEDWTSARR